MTQGRQIALIEVPILENRAPIVAGARPVAAFALLGQRLDVALDPAGEVLELRLGRRRFAVSMLDLAATAALAVERQLRFELAQRLRVRPASAPAADQETERDGFITLHPAPSRRAR